MPLPGAGRAIAAVGGCAQKLLKNSDFGGKELMMLPSVGRQIRVSPTLPTPFPSCFELGVKRDQLHSYKPAGKKSDQPGAPGSSAQDTEAEPVRRGNIATGKTKLRTTTNNWDSPDPQGLILHRS
ncbi:hypothetical protein PGT21_012571 [Puccinia graminis f. sp. tritici]|uniref:Uncharacterized protein n=1 Tax=Puccinia graminis f. sp. tritici TaxID=56615 RepID=A0A5B0P5D9_PUCGR|nr:hypothetical protein PGT21_012571 [Puccinia graminis f. sp. tritici]KAA1132115.1 hypothetical protein PGTUg99_037223 [Puccinia graminis f. sp. tritici]